MEKESYYFEEDALASAKYYAEKCNGYIKDEPASCDSFSCPAELNQ